MPDPDTISADYSLRPGELAGTLALLVEARQPTLVWGAPRRAPRRPREPMARLARSSD